MSDTNKPAPPEGNNPQGTTVEPFAIKTLLAWGLLIVFALNLGLFVRTFIGSVYYIPTQSMSPTLNGEERNGDRVWVNKIAYAFDSTPETGDLVVFHAPEAWHAEPTDVSIVKRVIATEGQTVGVNENGRVTVDGVELDEPYLGSEYEFKPGVLDCTTTPASQRCFPATVLGEWEIWVMGDNRTNSADSAFGCLRNEGVCQGPINESDLIGQASARVFPLSRLGLL